MASAPASDASVVDEDALARKAVDGDRRAFDALWRELNPRLRRYLASLGLREVDDVASQAWVEAIARLDAIDQRPHAFRRVLFTIARRRMIDEVRRSGRRQPRSLDDIGDIAERDGALGYSDDLGKAVDLLSLLPAAQAEVVALRVVGGFSAEEVGALTGRSAGAVRVMAHRGLRSLEDLLTPAPAITCELRSTLT